MPAVQPQTLEWDWHVTPLGVMAGACTPQGVCALVFCDSAQAGLHDINLRMKRRYPVVSWHHVPDALASVWRWLDAYFDAGAMQVKHPTLNPGGTPFQMRVWSEMSTVAAGQRISYTGLAARLGMQHGARAVATACAANPLALLIPCHRIVAANGQPSGYRWGVERKQALLQMEMDRRSGTGS